MDSDPDHAVLTRLACAEDEAFVLALLPELAAFGPPPWRDAERMLAVDVSVMRDALDPRSPDSLVLVASVADRLVGFIHLCEEIDYYGGRCGHVGDIVVAPDARGRGVGRALLAAGEAWARARGYALLTLNVFVENSRAQALYEELGFRPETVRHVKVLDGGELQP